MSNMDLQSELITLVQNRRSFRHPFLIPYLLKRNKKPFYSKVFTAAWSKNLYPDCAFHPCLYHACSREYTTHIVLKALLVKEI